MEKRFHRRYPQNDRIYLDGGLNSKYPKALIQDNESPDCANVVFDDGAVSTRGGTEKLTSIPVATFACDGLYTRTDNDGPAQTMCAWFGGKMYTWDASTFTTVPSAVSVFTAGTRVFSAEYENYLFFGNGNSTPYKYGGDSDTFTRHGVPQPSSSPTAGTAPTGTGLTGDYLYKVSFVNSNLVEGNVSGQSATFTAANENIRLTSIPVAPQSHGVSSRRLYRTEASGTVFKRVATINDNTTTTYDDGVVDADLGIDASSDQGEPPNYSAIIYHQGRLFVIDPTDNLVKYSEIGNPYVFKATSFLRIGDNSADTPVGFNIYDNSLVVFCRANPWIVYMPSTTDSDWAVLRVRANFGSRSPLGSFKFDSQVMFPAIQNDKFVGFAALQGQTITPSASILTSTALGSELQSERIEPDIFDVLESNLDDIVSIVYQNKAYITVTKGAGSTENNRIYIFDYSIGRINGSQPSWVPWTGLNSNAFTILNGNLYFGDSTATGFVREMNTVAYNDDGAAIDSYIWTKEFSGYKGEENFNKDFRWAYFFYERVGNFDMNYSVRVDSSAGSGLTDQINLDAGGSNWGEFIWGQDDWDPGREDGEIKKALGTFRGKRIQFKFSNQNVANQHFKIYGLNFFYNKKGLR